MCNICRGLTLYKKFWPMIEERENLAEYIPFGYYDGISVSNNLFENSDEKYVFSHLWEESINKAEKVDETYLHRTIYVFRSENDIVEDAFFWLDDKDELEYPFLFLLFIQLDVNTALKKSDSLKKIFDLENGIKQNYTKELNSKCKIITYLTLDSSDLILVIRCKEYKIGEKLVKDLHSSENLNMFNKYMGCNISYCNTIISIKEKFWNNKYAARKAKNQSSNIKIYSKQKREDEREKNLKYDEFESCLKEFRSVGDKYTHIKKYVIQIFNFLQKMNSEDSSLYLYSMLIHSAKMMRDILVEAAENKRYEIASEKFWKYQKAFYSSIHNISNEDRQFTLTDFKMEMYDVPVKLVVFFDTYMNRVKECLNWIEKTRDEKICQCEFLICPAEVYSTQITELFEKISEFRRLFLVEIPEYQIYDGKLMLIVLGREIVYLMEKKSEDKLEIIMNISGKIVTSYIKKSLEIWEDDKWKTCMKYVCSSECVWNEMKEEITKELSEQYHKFKDQFEAMGYKEEVLYSLQMRLSSILKSDKLWKRIELRVENYMNASSEFKQQEKLEFHDKVQEIRERIDKGNNFNDESFKHYVPDPWY